MYIYIYIYYTYICIYTYTYNNVVAAANRGRLFRGPEAAGRRSFYQ